MSGSITSRSLLRKANPLRSDQEMLLPEFFSLYEDESTFGLQTELVNEQTNLSEINIFIPTLSSLHLDFYVM